MKINHSQIIYTLLLPLTIFYSCVRESLLYPPTDNSESGYVTLTLNSGELSTPTLGTRANEGIDTGKEVWVILFSGNDSTAIFHSIFLAQGGTNIGTSPAGEGIYNYSFKAPTINSPVRLLILANTPDSVLFTAPPYRGKPTPNQTLINDPTAHRFNIDNLSTALTGKSYAQTVNTILNAPMLGYGKNGNVVFDPVEDRYNKTADYIPMSGMIDLPALNTTVNIGTPSNPVLLTRAVAKITVTSTAANFRITQVTAFGMPMNGSYCPPTKETLRRDNDLNIGHYCTANGIFKSPNGGETTLPFYVYEYNFNPNKYDPKGKENRPLIVVRGNYTDSEGTKNCWYTLAFPSDQIVRNHHYHFTISAVENPGIESALYRVGEAYAAANSLQYKVNVTDLSSHDIERTGDTYVALSNSALTIYESFNENPRNNLIALNVTTTATAGTTIELVDGEDDYIKLMTPTTLPLASPFATNPISYEVTFAMDQPGSISDLPNASATLFLRYTNFTKIAIPITRLPSFPKPGGVLSDFATNEYVTAQISNPTVSSWIRLSNHPTINQRLDRIAINSGGIHLHIEPNNSGIRRTAELYLGRRTNSGRMKVILTQSATQTQNRSTKIR